MWVDLLRQFILFPAEYARALAEPSIPAIVLSILVWYTAWPAAVPGPPLERAVAVAGRWAATVLVSVAVYVATGDEYVGPISIYGTLWALLFAVLSAHLGGRARDCRLVEKAAAASAAATVALLAVAGAFEVLAVWALASAAAYFLLAGEEH